MRGKIGKIGRKKPFMQHNIQNDTMVILIQWLHSTWYIIQRVNNVKDIKVNFHEILEFMQHSIHQQELETLTRFVFQYKSL